MKFLSPKCSIAVDGISLTVNNLSKNGFSVSIIPFTWQNLFEKHRRRKSC